MGSPPHAIDLSTLPLAVVIVTGQMHSEPGAVMMFLRFPAFWDEHNHTQTGNQALNCLAGMAQRMWRPGAR